MDTPKDNETPSEETPVQELSTSDIEVDVAESDGVLNMIKRVSPALAGLSTLLVVVIGAIAYMNSLNIAFYYPDDIHIVENTALHSLSTLSEANTHDELRMIPALSLSLNWIMAGNSSRAFHIGNILFHLMNAVLVYLITRRLLGVSKTDITPLISGMLFAAHPLTTQTVNTLLSRSYLLSAFFVLIAVWGFLKSSDDNPVRFRYWFLSVTAFLLAWSCGPWAWAVPVLILMADLTVTGSLRKSYYIVHGSYWTFLLFMWIQMLGQSSEVTVGASLLDAYAIASETLQHLGIRSIWPRNLSVSYPPADGGFIWGVALAASFTVFYRFRRAGFALIWVTVCIGAYSYWGSGSTFREELVYLPLAGVMMLLPIFLSGIKSLPARQLLGALSAVLIVACMATTSARNQVWRSEAALWIDANDKCIECVEPLERLAILNGDEGTRMLRELQFDAVRLSVTAEEDREEAMSYIRDAIDLYILALDLAPKSSDMWRQMGQMQQLDNQLEAAHQSFLRSLALDPNQSYVLYGLAEVAESIPNDIAGAATYYSAAERIGTLPATSVMRYGVLLADLGRYGEAQRLLQAHPVVVQQGNLQALMKEVGYKTESFAAARGGLQQAVKLNREPVDLLRLSSLENYYDGKYLMAGYLLEEVHRVDSLSIDDWVLLGVARSHVHNLDSFIGQWPNGYPDQAPEDAWRRVALSLAGERNWEDALRVLIYRQEKTGAKGIPRVLLGDMAVSNNAIQEAVGLYQQAMESHPDAYEPWLAMGSMAAKNSQGNPNRQAIVGNFLREAAEKGAPSDELEAVRALVGLKVPAETDSSLPERSIIR